MSEQENMQAVKDAYAAFARGDVASILSSLTDDVEWNIPGPPEIPYAGVRRGHKGAAEFFRLLSKSDEVKVFEPRAFLAAGDLVIVFGRYAALVKSTGETAETDWVHTFDFRGGKVARWRQYYDSASYAKAYRAAGEGWDAGRGTGNNRSVMKTDKLLRDLSLLAARLTLGGTMAAHGAQKLFGAFGGPGIEGASQFMDSLGFQPGEKYARASSRAELTAGTLIALGALGPVGPAMVVSVMLTAIETVHRPKGFWNTGGGYEMNVMFILLALLLATEGYGSFSLDAALGLHRKTGATLGWLGLAGGVAAAYGFLQQREIPQQQQQPSAAERGETETPATVS